jgi:uncharacterized membrane protein
MIPAYRNDVAPDPVVSVTALGCAVLGCLFVVSAVILVIVLVRRNRKGGAA